MWQLGDLRKNLLFNYSPSKLTQCESLHHTLGDSNPMKAGLRLKSCALTNLPMFPLNKGCFCIGRKHTTHDLLFPGPWLTKAFLFYFPPEHTSYSESNSYQTAVKLAQALPCPPSAFDIYCHAEALHFYGKTVQMQRSYGLLFQIICGSSPSILSQCRRL